MWMFIISLTIPFLIWGPFFPDLIVSLSALVFLVYVVRKKKLYYFYNKPLIFFFIFCIYCIFVSVIIAKNTLLSLESSLFYFRIGVFACLICYLIDKNQKILSYFYYSLVICFSALIVDGYTQVFTGYNIFGLSKISTRTSSFFGDELIMGSYLSRLFPLLFGFFLIKKKKLSELYYVSSLFILTSGLIYSSGERSSFFLFILSFMFIMIFIKQFIKLRIILFTFFLILILLLNFIFAEIKARMITTTIVNMSAKTLFTPQHDSLMRTAYNMFLDKPIFGHGPKMFRVVCKEEKYSTGITPCMTHPHNFYVQLLAETGVVGFIFLFSVFAYVLYCAYRQLKSIILSQKRYLTDYQVCLLAGILITVWPLNTNGNFFHNWLMIVYSLPIGFYLHSIYGKNRKNISF